MSNQPALVRIGKTGASLLGRTLQRGGLLPAMEKLELFARNLQSKGVDTALSDQIKSVSPTIKSDAVVFDVGANAGNWTRELLRQCGARVAQVHCFEPVDVNIAKIRSIDSGKVSIHAFAVGREDTESEFYSDFAGSGTASLYERDTPDALACTIREVVKVRTLDAVIAELGITRIDLLKMDIEGSELDALGGLSQGFAAGVVRAFTFEIGAVNITARTYFSDFFKFASAHGFRVYRLTSGGGLFPITTYRVSHECFATTNYLAALGPV